MIEASVDIGTNTILMLVAEVEPSVSNPKDRKICKVLEDRQEIVKLGQGVSRNKNFLPEAMERAYQALQEVKRRCDSWGVQQIYAVATSASRDARNASEYYERIHRELGIQVRIIPGELEAVFGFQGGLMSYQDTHKTALIDIGGGSTEFVIQDGGQSLNIGSVRASEMYLVGDPYDKKSIEALESGLKSFWPQLNSALQSSLRQFEWTGVAGTITTLAALHQGLSTFESLKVDGFRMSRCTVGDLYESLAIQSQSQRASHPIIGIGRADVITAGAAILYSAMEYFDKDEIVVSTRGLRYGVIQNASRLINN